MNRDNTLALIAFMEDEEKQKDFRFDMDTVLIFTPCGAAGCLIGEELVRKYGIDNWPYVGQLNEARTSLGLTEEQADELFFPSEYVDDRNSPWHGHADPYAATREDGINALKRALELWAEKR